MDSVFFALHYGDNDVTKATQAKAEPHAFTVPKERIGGECAYCGTPIRDYYGQHVGSSVYCDWSCFTAHHLEDRSHEFAT